LRRTVFRAGGLALALTFALRFAATLGFFLALGFDWGLGFDWDLGFVFASAFDVLFGFDTGVASGAEAAAADGSAAECSANAAPAGSAMTVMRLPPGTSMGGCTILPPEAVTTGAATSTLGTRTYGSQYGGEGMSGGLM
jgi:hypothetical protein